MTYVSDPNDFLFDDEVNEPVVETKRRKQMKKPKEMSMIAKVVIKECVNKLKAAGCSMKVLMPDGEVLLHDPDNQLDSRKRHRDPNTPYAYGDLKRHYGPHLENLKVGDVAIVPYTDALPYDKLQASMTAYMSTAWGKGTYATVTNKDTKCIEVLRLA